MTKLVKFTILHLEFEERCTFIVNYERRLIANSLRVDTDSCKALHATF